MAKIKKTASGKYAARVYMGVDSSGHKKYKQFTHSDKRILQTIVAEFENTHREYQESDKFSVCLDKYIKDRKGILSPSTIRGYKSIQNVLETQYGSFCSLTLQCIGRNDVQRIVNDLNKQGRSGKYIKNIHGIMSAVMKENGYVMPHVALPSGKPVNTYEPSKEDIRRTLEAARGTDMEIPILLGIHGLRRGEICALKYPDDFSGNVIHVQRCMVYDENQNVVIKETKTDESDRLVPLSDECCELIRKQGYVTEKTLAAVTQAFTKLLRRNDIPKYRFHDLRHFFASYMHDLGFSDAQIMKLGGWKTDNVMKNIYRYAMPDTLLSQKINSAMNDLTG